MQKNQQPTWSVVKLWSYKRLLWKRLAADPYLIDAVAGIDHEKYTGAGLGLIA